MRDKQSPGTQWVVAHRGSRDDYQLPIALRESGQLHRFVTDWYSPLDNVFLNQALKLAPESVRSILAQRYRVELPSELVADAKLRECFHSAVRWKWPDQERNLELGERAARVASDSGSHLLITSYYGWAAFPKLRRETRKVLFQIHPDPEYLWDIYSKMQGIGRGDENFQDELEMKVDRQFLLRWGRESLDADLVIAASSFTRKSLVCAGVKAEKIVVVPYGVDGLVYRDDVDLPAGKAKALFIGQATARKGFVHLLQAWERMAGSGAELHIVSGGAEPWRKMDSGGSVIWHDRLMLQDLIALLNRVDLLVLPSIAEGFGHVLLQALSCGTPVLCSDATAGPDLLKGWEDGFVFRSCDWEGLATRLEHWLTHPERLRGLRKSARTLAKVFRGKDFGKT